MSFAAELIRPTRKQAAQAITSPMGVAAHDAIVQGLPSSALAAISKQFNRLDTADIYAVVGISERTAQRLKAAEPQAMDIAASDGIHRLLRAYELALDVLGSDQAAQEWLAAEALGLEGRRPIDLLRTTPGAALVMLLLQRMLHGIYA